MNTSSPDFISRNSFLNQRINQLPRREDVEIRFVDYDGTLFPDERRFEVDPELRQYRGDSAYPYIEERYRDPENPGIPLAAYRNFIRLLDPSNHLFVNISDFYDSTNSDHVILTAGNIFFQNEKIDQSGFAPNASRVLVRSAGQKPQAMIEHILNRSYIPGKVSFYDDRIMNFDGWDRVLSGMFGIPFEFYQASGASGVVNMTKVTSGAVLDSVGV